MSKACEFYERTPQAYYLRCHQAQTEEEGYALLESWVVRVRKKHPQMGGKKLYYKYCDSKLRVEFQIGRDKFLAFLSERGLQVRKKRKFSRTTDSQHWLKKYPNKIQGMQLTGPEQLWVSDITYLRVGDSFGYLSLITDAYSRKVVGYRLHKDLGTEGCLKSLEMALTTRTKNSDLYHHSDRGIQYCSNKYVRTLNRNDIQISMTENGDPRENAVAERINGILKYEYALVDSYATMKAAASAVKQAIDLYNNERPHASCNYLTPAQAHQMTGELKRRW